MATRNEIKISGIYKKHGGKEILRNISFAAKEGKITAFLGPNGAGKSSTLRILLGLDKQLAGDATFSGQRYEEIGYPLTVVGAAFDGIGGAPSRKVKTHLKMIALSNRISLERVAKVMEVVDIAHKSQAKIGDLSLGEGQRLGLAAALLGDPQYIVLDEPTNGLDPLGIRWFRQFIREQAKAGKTILLSSHLLSEVEAVADDIVIINQGEIIAAGTLAHIMESLPSLEDVFFSLTEGRERPR